MKIISLKRKKKTFLYIKYVIQFKSFKNKVEDGKGKNIY